MFVKIVKGNMSKKVTKDSYDNYYKNSGWELKDSYLVDEVETDDEVSDEGWDDVIEEEKNLSDMNRSELEKKAASLGVDISDCNSNKQIRDRLKGYIK